MREIKFRIWGQMSIGVMGMYYGGFSIHATGKIEPLAGLGPREPITLMQSTGLKDKNGKEIYEGDCANVTLYLMSGVDQNEAEILEPESCVCDVFYSKDGFSVNFEGIGALPLSYCEDIEIIGNIHQNPELLKK